MEVHAHTHTPRKKWTHYFWEFLMLFLAVFCGFLAENQREHMVEHKREKQYIRSFIEDLKADTTKINQVLETSMMQHIYFDSLMGVLKEPGFAGNPVKIEKYIGSIYRLPLFNHTDRTLQQLKHAGGLRLIRNQDASDSIIRYDNLVKEASEQGVDVYNSNQGTINLTLQIFDGNSPNSRNINRDLVPKPEKIRLITKDAAKLDEFFNRVVNFKVASIIYCRLLYGLKEYAGRQIIFLKEEYHLK
jgi:hypothetical protein